MAGVLSLTFGLKKGPSNKLRQLPVIETGQSSILSMQPKEVHIIGLRVIHERGALEVDHHAKGEKSLHRHFSDLVFILSVTSCGIRGGGRVNVAKGLIV